MKSINEHVSLIEEWLQTYKPNDDFDIPRTVILSFMNTARSALIREDINFINSSMYQRIDCLEVKTHEVSCPVDGFNVNLESMPYVELPNLIGGLNGKEIGFLGTSDFAFKANLVSLDGLISMKYSTWSKDAFSFALIDNKAYLSNIPNCNQNIRLSGLFLLDNPMDVTDSWDVEYPCHSDHRLFVVTTQLISSAFNMRPDDFNNARYDTVPAVPQSTQQQQEE
jgi:hypothetical protein